MSDANDSLPVFSDELFPTGSLSIGQLLDRIFRLMKIYWRIFLGVAGVPFAIGAVIFAALFGAMMPTLMQMAREQAQGLGAAVGKPPVWFPIAFLCCYPVFMAVFAIYMAAASFAANQADLGVGVTVRQAYDAAWKRCGRFLWLMVLCVLCVMVPILVIGLLLGGAAVILGLVHSSPTGVFLVAPFLVLLYIGIFVSIVVVMLRLAVAFPACVEEDLTAWAAVRRSFALTRNAMGRIFVVMLVIYAISYAVILVIMAIFFAVVAGGAAVGIATHVTKGSPVFYVLVALGILVYSVVVLLYGAICHSVLTTAIAVIYHDQRQRLEWLMPVFPAIQNPNLP